MRTQYVQFFESLRNPLLTPFFLFITALGDELFYIAAVAFFYWVWDKRLAIKLAMGITMSSYLNSFLKLLIKSPRPYASTNPEEHWIGVNVEEYKQTMGMPSGHAQGSVTFWGILAYELKNKKFWIFAIIIVLLIGISRLYLAVHFLEDVIVGWILGIIIVIVFEYLWAKTEPIVEELQYQQKIALSFSPLILFLVATASFGFDMDAKFGAVTMGALTGILLGHLLQERYIGIYSRPNSLLEGTVRIFVGYMILVPLVLLLSILQHTGLDNSPQSIQLFATLIRYFFIGLILTTMIPALFTKIEIE